MSRKTVLVSGGAGFIGTHVTVELSNAGYDVVIADNFSNCDETNYKGVCQILGKELPLIKMDFCDAKAVNELFDAHQIDAVIHFAAYKAVGESVAQPLKYFRNNLHSFENLVELMATRGKGANIVFSSSATVYGQPALDELPIVEEQPFQEASSPYARTKQMAEGILQDCVKAYPNLNATVLRYFNPIGAHPSALIGELPNGVPNNLVPFITQTAAGIRDCLNVFGNDYNTPDGSCIRDYIYVVDLAKAHVKAVDKMLSEGARWNVYNLGTGKGLSVLELVNAFISATGVDLKYRIAERRPGDVEQYWADPSKANRELGWSADTPIGEVLISAWKWQQALKG